MPLKLHEFNATIFNKGCIEYLDKAENVCVTEAIDAPHSLTFDYPMIDDKAEKIIENRIVSVEGQAYRLYDVARTYSGSRMLKARARRIFFYDAEMHHIPTIGNDTDPSNSTIGVDPYVVIRKAIEGTKFELIPDDELAEMGMTRLGADGLKIDFFPTDKINTYNVIKNVIETAGKGEIYVDNFRVAVVESIGEDSGVRLTLTKNIKSLTVQYAVDDMLTRVYPYGADDLTISSVNNGVPYLDSPEGIEKYGIIEGYLDYPDYSDPEKLMAHAKWDLMGEDNDKRFDIPRLTLTGDIIDLSKLAEYGDMEKIRLGDTVRVYDDNNMYKKRITNITYYPFENKQPTVTIGAPSIRSTFFQAWQQSRLFHSIKKNTARGSKLKTNYFTGTVNSTQNPVRSENKKLLLDGDCLVINDPVTDEKRLELGNVDGQFTLNIYSEDGNTLKIKLGDHGSNGGENYAFAIYDNDGRASIYMDESGEVYFAGKLETLKNASIGQELIIGAVDESISKILMQGETNATEIINDDINKIFKISPSFGGDLVIDENGIKFDGHKLATASSVSSLADKIRELQQRVTALESK